MGCYGAGLEIEQRLRVPLQLIQGVSPVFGKPLWRGYSASLQIVIQANTAPEMVPSGVNPLINDFGVTHQKTDPSLLLTLKLSGD